MKHLRKFNEDIISWNKDREELEKFCDENLAYLKDDRFDIKVRIPRVRSSDSYHLEISISRDPHCESSTFKWDDIKYDFISFLHELIRKYNLNNKLSIFFHHDILRSKNRIFKFVGAENIEKILSGKLRSTRGINEIRITF